MALTHEEIQQLKKEIFAESDEKYVAIEICNAKQNEVNLKFANDDKRIDKLIDRVELWNKLLWTIAASGLGTLVAAVLGLIIK